MNKHIRFNRPGEFIPLKRRHFTIENNCVKPRFFLRIKRKVSTHHNIVLFAPGMLAQNCFRFVVMSEERNIVRCNCLYQHLFRIPIAPFIMMMHNCNFKINLLVSHKLFRNTGRKIMQFFVGRFSCRKRRRIK